MVKKTRVLSAIVVGTSLALAQEPITGGVSHSIGNKTARATEALSSEEGSKAESAADAISEDTIKALGE